MSEAAKPVEPKGDVWELAKVLHDQECPDRKCTPTTMGRYIALAQELLGDWGPLRVD